MLLIISPAKTLDFTTPAVTRRHTKPVFLDHAGELVEQLRSLKPSRLARLMNISAELASLNADRYQEWSTPFTPRNARQALLVFKGDVYQGLDAGSLDLEELAFAQQHLRIVSGLYGLLRPLDLIQPYRLEMGLKFSNRRGGDLYSFWGDQLAQTINKELRRQQDDVLVNLASHEYFKAVKKPELTARVITPVFRDRHKGEYKVLSFFAKKARGLMCRYVIQNRLTDPGDLQDFNLAGYRYNRGLSNGDEWVFTRKKPA